MSNYENIGKVAAHGGAPANAGMARRQTPGMAGGNIRAPECTFPAPPPPRHYCTPAAFTNTDGLRHHRIIVAYGSSRPAAGYY